MTDNTVFNESYRKRITFYVFLTILASPPLWFLNFWFLDWFEGKEILSFLMEPAIYIQVAVFATLGTLSMNKTTKQVKQMFYDKEYLKAQNTLFFSPIKFPIATLLYGLTFYFVLQGHGLSWEEMKLPFMMAPAISILATMPFLIFITKNIEHYWQPIPFDPKGKVLSLKARITGVTIISLIATIYICGIGVFMLVTKHMDGNTFALSTGELTAKLLAVLSISLIQMALPVFFLSTQVSKEVQRIQEFADALAGGNLQEELHVVDRNELGVLISDLRKMQQGLRTIIFKIQESTAIIHKSGTSVTESAITIQTGAQRQEHAAAELEASITEIQTSIQQSSDYAQTGNSMTSEIAINIQTGSHAVTETVESMKEILEKISVVGGIAKQTNLLSINASIEASRFGMDGKSFGVIAKEVGTLAQNSRELALMIDTLSAESIKTAENSQNLLETLVPKAEKTAGLINEINMSNNHQRDEIANINQSIINLSQVTREYNSSASTLAQNAEQLQQYSDELNGLIMAFKV